MTEYDPEGGIFYGFVTGMPFPEWGSMALQEFIDLKLPLEMKIERDIHFPFQPFFSDAVSEAEKHYG